MNNQNNDFMSIFNNNHVDVNDLNANGNQNNNTNNNNINNNNQSYFTQNNTQQSFNPNNNINPNNNNSVPNNLNTQQSISSSMPQQINNTNSINYGNNTVLNQQQTINNKSYNYDDEELVKLYVGENYEIISRKSFNFSAFFFTALYFAYRKMYVASFVLMIIEAILTVFFIRYSFIISIVLGLICGFVFNESYINDVREKIKKLRNDNSIDIKDYCIQNGGTSFLIAFLGSFVYGTILSIVLSITYIGNFLSNFHFSFHQSKNYDEIERKADDFYSRLSHYGEWSVIQKNSNGTSISMVNGRDYKYAIIPTAQDGGNIACVLDKGSSVWHDSEKYVLSNNSTSCNEYMNDFVSNYLKEINSEEEEEENKIKVPESAEIIFSSDGYLQPKSVVTYDGVKCEYTETEEVECK